MRIPSRTAELSIGPAVSIRPMATISCLSGCVGSEAARRCGGCGADLACWQRCTGVADISCVAACLRA